MTFRPNIPKMTRIGKVPKLANVRRFITREAIKTVVIAIIRGVTSHKITVKRRPWG